MALFFEPAEPLFRQKPLLTGVNNVVCASTLDLPDRIHQTAQ